ncbi:hypothetical protein [Microbacterium sp. KNMS]
MKLAPPTELEVRGHSHPDADTWHIHFGWPSNPLPMNGARGNRHAATRAERDVRDHAHQVIQWFAKVPALGRCRAELTWWVPDRIVRDPDNLARLEKRLFDAIVRAGVVPDDRPDLMDKPRARIRPIADSDGLVSRKGFTLTITRLEEATP